RLLGTGNRHRLAVGCRSTHTIEFGPAKLASAEHLGPAASSLHGRAVERHRVLAGTDQDFPGPVGHLLPVSFFPWCPAEELKHSPNAARQTAGRGTFMGHTVICKKRRK